jgi:hypothetical protein
MLFTGPQTQLPGILFSVLRAERVYSTDGAIGTGKLRRYDLTSRRAGIHPPTRTPLALRTDGKLIIPIDCERAKIIAVLHLRTMPIVLYRTHQFDAMPSAALKGQLAADI